MGTLEVHPEVVTEENSPWIIQARAYPDGEEFVAECLQLPIQVRAESLDRAVTGLHPAIQEYLKEYRDKLNPKVRFDIVLSFYFGPLDW